MFTADDRHRLYELAYILGINLERKDGLLLPDEFFRFVAYATKKQFSDICNGAGPKGYGFLVPNTMYLLNLRIVFDGHDFCYDRFKTDDGKELSDLLMKLNMSNFIEDNSIDTWIIGDTLKFLRKRRALKYYWGVHYGGDWFHSND